MDVPIFNYVNQYLASDPTRLHMPGHKGWGPLDCEDRDLTEIPGADSLYEADGVIAASERNASGLFACPTLYSTEGSSHCIRAMLFLAMQHKAVSIRGRRPGAYTEADEASPQKPCGIVPSHSERSEAKPKDPDSPSLRVLAARNVHRTFLSAAALLDLDVRWLWDESPTYLSADPTPASVERAILSERPDALYLTSPDYLGHLVDLGPIADVCHRHGVLLLVDNAHGAYLHFLPEPMHPMDLGADLCCDSAHKTCPVLTGGAWLHVSQRLGLPTAGIRDALALFGSTSPSYLILQSLDLCNPWLEALPGTMPDFLPLIETLKTELRAEGWTLCGDEPWKLTLRPRLRGRSGVELAEILSEHRIWCEFFDSDFVVLMFTPSNLYRDFDRLREALASIPPCPALPETALPAARPEQVCSLREAMLSPCVRVPAVQSLGRVLARPGVSCPPAVPIRMPGERIDEAAIAAFDAYEIQVCDVLP